MAKNGEDKKDYEKNSTQTGFWRPLLNDIKFPNRFVFSPTYSCCWQEDRVEGRVRRMATITRRARKRRGCWPARSCNQPMVKLQNWNTWSNGPMLSLLQADDCLVFESQVVVIAEIDRSVGRVDHERSFSLTSSTTGSERYINHWLETTTSTSNIPI